MMKFKRNHVFLLRVVSACFAVLLMLLSGTSQAAPQYSMTMDASGRHTAMPVSYVADYMEDYFGEGVGALSNPQDLFYRDGKIYVADTGNNRILVMDKRLRTLAAFTGGEKPFSTPHGVYADKDGDIFVADTGNGLIVHLAPDGTFVEAFTQPESELFDEGYRFRPLKLCIDTIGQFYVINYEDYHGFIVINALGEFKGYVAPTKVESTILDKMISFLATEEQKAQLEKKLPPVHTNFCMDNTGALFVTTSRASTAQLKKYLSYGSNIFPYTGVFGNGFDESKIVDVSVSQDGIITLLEGDSGELFQYDEDGVLLTSFGGSGNWKGVFMSASSLCEDENGVLYVLDAGTGAITTFKPTSFITKVHEALKLYHAGQYEASMSLWDDVLEVDRNYAVARIKMGKACMRQEKYAEALVHYEIANDKSGYSAAFSELRHETFREYFGLIVAAVLALIIAIYYLVKLARRYASKLSTSL